MPCRVECRKSGGIWFTINRNPYFVLVLVSNVRGVGDIISVSVMSSNSNQWEEMLWNWGQNWQSNNSRLVGQILSFCVTTYDGNVVTSYDIGPPD